MADDSEGECLGALPMFQNMTTDTVDSHDNSSIPCDKRALNGVTMMFLIFYSIICIAGLFGNGLVIIVVLKYDRLKTVTNLYILNLSIADSLFLIVIPIIVTVAIVQTWIFGTIVCKLFFALDCINKFTSAFTVTVMAGDRYMAACHPITSLMCRTPRYAAIILTTTWVVSFIVMSPAIIYAEVNDCFSCLVNWSKGGFLNESTFTAYTLILAFIIPVTFICIFYTLIIMKLRKGGQGNLSHRRHCQFRKATRLVTLVICVFIICWLPYWIAQIILLTSRGPPKQEIFLMYQIFTVFSYANSMLNPLLYGFTNEYFREAFNSAFHCVPAQTMPSSRQSVRCDDAGKICHHLEATFDKNGHQGSIEMTSLRTVNKTETKEAMTQQSNLK